MTDILPKNLKPISLQLDRDQRGALIGKTGSGKTYLAKAMLRRHTGNLCILDPKRMFLKTGDFEDLGLDMVCSSLAEVKFWRPRRFVYRPRPDDFGNLAAYDGLYEWCYKRGNILVYTDDMVGIVPQGRSLRFLQVCYQMGRERNVSMLSAMQRPVFLPPYMFSDSEKFYAFFLQYPDDIKRVSAYVPGFDVNLVTPKYRFEFYDNAADMRPVCLKLDRTGALQSCQ
jgi:energy-coupling factor transporter ATP-binding protein EcfA2